ncbi:bZIP transcription factor 12-like [Panicum virgatum]|uniref:BZIP domain-containing protein n=1 Tax=Panicum virgatum TaxID=38727 RepID=A0A8T0U8B2_PANVG|nr:bZIP transcription factor 12-like [Panicum virgatum]KAG2619050.1 hypothetical protein PVAP13_3NG140761 [Panicum virgatum]
MASSRVMASSSPPQPAGAGSSSDLARFTSGSGIGSMNMDDIIRNIYGPEAVAGGGAAEPSPAPAAAARRTSEEVWKEISATGGLSVPALPPPPPAAGGGSRARGGAAEMTLEDFLARDSGARAVAAAEGNMALGFPVPDGDAAGAGAGAARGPRKRALVNPADRAVMQRQKRMIKNRESAARSRDRKQAYVAELESQVTQLEEEQAELLTEQEERRQKRLKELMERAFPVIRKKLSRDLRRTNSMEW